MRESASYRTVRMIIIVLLVAFAILPLYTIITTSVSPPTRAGGSFSWLPSSLEWRSYVDMWSTNPLLRYFANSAFVAVVSTVISLCIGVVSAYAITRFQFIGQRLFLMAILTTQTFPGVLFLLPLFVIFVTIQHVIGITLVGSYTGLILTYLTFALPFSIWLLTTYIRSIPRDMEEAAQTDGATEFGAFVRITLRTGIMGLMAVGVFTFMTAWSEVLFASVLTNEATRTLPIGLPQYENPLGGNVYWNQLMAAALTVSVPMVVGFIALQRYFVRGLSLTK